MGLKRTPLLLADDLLNVVLEIRTHSETNVSYYTRLQTEIQRKGWCMSIKRKAKIRKEIIHRQNELESLLSKLKGALQAFNPTAGEIAIADKIWYEATRIHREMTPSANSILAALGQPYGY